MQKTEENSRTAHLARADCCRFLAAFFYPPDRKLLVEEGLAEKFTALLEIACPGAMPLARPIPEYLQGGGQVELAVAYTRLFLGPPVMQAPPYASFYLDQKASVMGPSSVEMMKVYRRAGVRLDDEFKEMPDHVTVVLEFLSLLFFRKAVALADKALEERAELEKMIAHFLNNYFFPWIPRFCNRIIAADEHPFYTALGKCLDAFAKYGFSQEEAVRHETL